jgi:Uma2 family endonuclease
MTTVADPAAAVEPPEVQRILLEGVPWERYEQLSACFVDTRSLRLTYIDGRLEIMSPIGEVHETRKRSLGYLLESWLDFRGIRYYGRGGFTLKQPGRAAGEPDESFCIGVDKPVPDLVIEVVVSRDALSKLPLYQALAIPEAWLWRRDQLEVFVLDRGAYHHAPSSRLFPGLDMDLLAAHVRMPDQYDAVRAFRRAIAPAHR